MATAYNRETTLLPIEAPPSLERHTDCATVGDIIRSQLPPLTIDVTRPDGVDLPMSRTSTPSLIDSRASSAPLSPTSGERAITPLHKLIVDTDATAAPALRFDDDDEALRALRAERSMSLSSSDSTRSVARPRSTSPRFFSVRRSRTPSSPMTTPRDTCTVCSLPSMRDDRQLLTFHRKVCARLRRVQDNPRVRQSPRRMLARSRPRLLIDALADDIVEALRSSVPIDVVVFVLLALQSRDAEQRVIAVVSGVDEDRLALIKPYLVHRLRAANFDVHRHSAAMLEVVMQFADHSEGVSLDRAMDRYASRKHDQWRRMRNNRPASPPVTPRRIICICRTLDDLSRFYWATVNVEAVDMSFTPMPTLTLPLALTTIVDQPPRPLFSGLRHLIASECALHSLPANIDALHALETLDVSHNYLCTLPATTGRLVRLRTLRANGNRLVVLDPASFSDTSRLERLDLSSNMLMSVPVDPLAVLTALERVDLSSNRLLEFPRKLGAVASLSWLSLMGNVPGFDVNELDARALVNGRLRVVLV